MSVIFDALRELDHEKSIDSCEGLGDIDNGKNRRGFSIWVRGALICLLLGVTGVIGFAVWNNQSKQVDEVAVEDNIQIKIAPLVDVKSVDQDVATIKPVRVAVLNKPTVLKVHTDEQVASVQTERLSQLKEEVALQAIKQPLLKQDVATVKPVRVAALNKPTVLKVDADEQVVSVQTERLSQLKEEVAVQAIKQPLLKHDVATAKPVHVAALNKATVLKKVHRDEQVASVQSPQLKTKVVVQAVKQPLLKRDVAAAKPVRVAVLNKPRTYAVKSARAVSTHKAIAKERQAPTIRLEKSSFQKQRNISQLIPQLQLAMAQKNETLVTQYLEELSGVSGSESVFVKKMRAYWALSNGRFDEALSRYQSIIAQKPNDIESQMNAALAEMQLKHFDNAYKRLVMLAGKYPNDARISSMQGQLKAIYPL